MARSLQTRLSKSKKFCGALRLCFHPGMPSVSLAALVSHCDKLLDTAAIEDWSGAKNGLQMENGGGVTRIAAAVDGCMATVRAAIDQQADLLIVHHGLFWGPTVPWTGRRYEMLKLLLENNLAVYSSHLPLDCHPKLGNNARLAAALGFKKLTPFFFEKGRDIGLKTEAPMTLERLVERLGQAVAGPVTVLPGGPERCRRIGIVTGGAGAELARAAAEGVDTFITGEGPHHTHALAEDVGINVLYAGHYATETFGVKALAEHLGKKYRLPWSFIDRPTGL
jgi:dinuclear metal center YbgI/SA1388 family protein